ncbi:unnamed protein product [Soboliphyme baturini]|uniref:Neur_chan_memb domain-containing protein n=1 Tax=Soboliphyme baturini TaxID=241478 RepID=A0A183IEE0_9BILA|nr:unnamed protein product [Soboliphyme baturini]
MRVGECLPIQIKPQTLMKTRADRWELKGSRTEQNFASLTHSCRRVRPITGHDPRLPQLDPPRRRSLHSLIVVAVPQRCPVYPALLIHTPTGRPTATPRCTPMTDLSFGPQLVNLSLDHDSYRNDVIDGGELSRIELGTRIFSWITVSIFGLCFSFLLLIHWRSNGYRTVRQVIEI